MAHRPSPKRLNFGKHSTLRKGGNIPKIKITFRVMLLFSVLNILRRFVKEYSENGLNVSVVSKFSGFPLPWEKCWMEICTAIAAPDETHNWPI
jgi:hypothetical protein